MEMIQDMLILRGRRDRRYGRRAAGILGARETVAYIRTETERTSRTLYERAKAEIKANDRNPVLILPTEYGFGGGSRSPLDRVINIAAAERDIALRDAEIALEPHHADIVLLGLQKISERQRIEDAIHGISASVASGMIASLYLAAS